MPVAVACVVHVGCAVVEDWFDVEVGVVVDDVVALAVVVAVEFVELGEGVNPFDVLLPSVSSLHQPAGFIKQY